MSCESGWPIRVMSREPPDERDVVAIALNPISLDEFRSVTPCAVTCCCVCSYGGAVLGAVRLRFAEFG